MWTIGVLEAAGFVPLAGAPTFAVETQAAAWVRRQLASNRISLAPGRALLTWRSA